MKTPILILSLFILSSCQTVRVQHGQQISTPEQKSIIPSQIEQENIQLPEVESPVIPAKKNEKIGLILGGGGVRVWSYISLLKEIQTYKLPIVAVAGVEWGAVVAATYAENISPNEVEWELSKFKSIQQWESFLKAVFEKKTTQNLSIPFSCSSFNLKNQKKYILSEGSLDELLPLCVASSLLTKPYKDSIALENDLNGLIQVLKQKGATKIIYFNLSNSQISSAIPGIDDIISVSVNSFLPSEFENRKKILNLSFPTEKEKIKIIVEKYGF